MISTGELKKGVVIELEGDLWQILDYHHIKMGRGSAQVRMHGEEAGHVPEPVMVDVPADHHDTAGMRRSEAGCAVCASTRSTSRYRRLRACSRTAAT